MKKQLLTISLLLAVGGMTAGQSSFCGGNTSPSSSTAFIYIYQDTPIDYNGETLEYGSYIIAVFQDSNGDWQCAGQTQWWGYNTILNVRGEDSETEGYEEGEVFKFFIQLPDDCLLQEVEADFLVDTQFAAGDTYTQAGKSRLSGLSVTFDPVLETTILADTCEAATGQIIINNIEGANAASILWSDGQNGFIANELAAGLMTAQITSTTGCIFSTSFDVPSVDCPLLEANATCNGFVAGDQGCIPFTAVFIDNSLSEAGVQSYFWDFGDGNTSNEPNPIHIYTTSGNYTVELTISDDYQTANQTFDIVAFATPIVEWNYETDICQPQVVTFSGQSSSLIDNWNWDFTNGVSSDQPVVTIDFEQTGMTISGTLQWIDENNCSSQIPIEIEIPESYDLEVLSETTKSPSCMEANGSITITPTGGLMPYHFTWQHDMENTTNMATMLSPGVYWVEVMDGNGCVDSLIIELEDNTQVPNPNLGADTTFCNNAIGELNAGGISGTLQWYFDGVAITGATTDTYLPEQSGIYVLEAINDDDCRGADTVMVSLLAPPLVNLGEDQGLCPAQTILLDASCENCVYEWNDGATSASIEVFTANEYMVTVSNENGCTNSDTIVIAALEVPVFSLGEDQQICEETATIIGTTTIEGATYNWSTGDTTAQINVTEAGEYVLTVTNEEGCIQIDSVEVLFLERPIASIFTSALQVCPGEEVQLGADGDGTYLWIDTSLTILNLDTSEISIAPSQNTTYGLIVFNECYSDTAYVDIHVVQSYLFGPRDTCIAFGNEVSLEAPLAATYNWWQADPNVLLSNNSTLTVSPDTTSLYYLQMTDTLGCVFQDSILVIVLQLQNLELKPVGIITPNGDGYNDVLAFDNITKFSPRTLTVFNRWGGVVYDSFDYQNDWDGTRNDEPLPAGVYYYVLRIGQQELRHSLTIIRE